MRRRGEAERKGRRGEGNWPRSICRDKLVGKVSSVGCHIRQSSMFPKPTSTTSTGGILSLARSMSAAPHDTRKNQLPVIFVMQSSPVGTRDLSNVD